MATTGEIIRYYLVKLDMSQGDLAKKCGVSRKTVWKWAEDENSPKLPHAYKIADAFGITLDELAGIQPSSLHDFRFDEITRMYHGLNEKGREYVYHSVKGAYMIIEFKEHDDEY